MDAIYLWLKVLHILAIAVWIGGAVALTVFNARLGRQGDAALMAEMGRQSAFLGQYAIGPAMIVALLAGLGMAFRGGFPLTSLWIMWGLAGWVLFILLGVAATGRAAAELGQLTQTAPSDPRIDALRGRLGAISAVNLLILASVVYAMVFKPAI
jgi:uncharacterized membrane protein